MRPKYEDTGGLMSAPCPAGSSRSYGAAARATLFSCSTKSISSASIFAETPPRRFWKYWIPRRTRPSRTTILIRHSICPVCSSLQRRTSWTTFQAPCATAWRSSSCLAIQSARSSRSASAIYWAGNSRKTGSPTASSMLARARSPRSFARTPARPACGTLSESLGASAGP